MSAYRCSVVDALRPMTGCGRRAPRGEHCSETWGGFRGKGAGVLASAKLEVAKSPGLHDLLGAHWGTSASCRPRIEEWPRWPPRKLEEQSEKVTCSGRALKVAGAASLHKRCRKWTFAHESDCFAKGDGALATTTCVHEDPVEASAS